MNRATRAVLISTLVAVGVLPLLTAHALLEETHHLRTEGPAALWKHPDILILVLLTVLAFIPLGRIAVVARGWFVTSARLRAVAAAGSRRSCLEINYVRVPGDGVTFCTAGLRRPTIYVSAGAESSLTPGQFRAALLHERAHVDRRDVLWLALVAALERALAVVPRSKPTFGMLRLVVERGADQRALVAGASRLDLFDAIVAASAPPMASGAALSEVGVLQRLRWLAEPQLEPIDETRMAAVPLATLITPPALAHLLLWTGVLCVLCSTHAG